MHETRRQVGAGDGSIKDALFIVTWVDPVVGVESVFLLDMGEPVKIVNLAEELIRLSNLEPYEDIDIIFTGLRPGEKLFEELRIDGEGIKKTDHAKIMVATTRSVDPKLAEKYVQKLKFCVRKGDPELVVEKLREIVPAYRPNRLTAQTRVQLHPTTTTAETPA